LLLRSLKLQNIRSYASSVATISFTSGFTCITGGVGQGKSTILLAIDFALTGKPIAGNYQYLLRESESRGLVELEFEHSDRIFKVHRVLERIKGEIRQKADECWIESNGKTIAKGKIEPITSALVAQTQIDPEVLRDVAWIRQERLKLLLNLRKEERQVLLDGLLGLENLREIGDHLGDAERVLSDRIRALEHESGGLTEDIQDLDRKRQRQSSLTVEIEDLKQILDENQLKLDELERKLQTIRERAEEYESQQRDVAVLQQKLTDLEQSMKKNQTALKRQQENERDLKEKLEIEEEQIRGLKEIFHQLGNEGEITGESLNIALRALRTTRDELREKLSELEHLSEETRRNILLLQDRDKCPLCRQDMVPLYRSTILQMFDSDLTSKEKQVSSLRSRYQKAERDLISLEELQSLFSLSSIERYRTQVEDATKAAKELEAEIQTQKREHSNAMLRLEELKAGLKDYSGLSEALRKTETERNQQVERTAEQGGRLKGLAKQKKDIEADISTLTVRIEQRQGAEREARKRKSGLQFTQRLREFLKGIRPRLREDFLDDLQAEVQRVLDEVSGSEDSAYVELDEFYTPSMIMNGQQRASDQLSGGERTLLAFTLSVGLAQLVYELKMHQSLDMLLLDEPTESLGTEDDSIQRLAETIRSMRSVQQIVAVTHSQDFAQYADHVLTVTKQLNQSRVEAIT
jgi:DNA repair exonuclease SbcCD ATPase subunit